MPQPRVERPTTPPPPPGHARIRPAGHPPQRAQSSLRQATRDKRALSDLIGVRSADAVGESARLTRDQPRLSFTIGHALAVILLLIVALGISLALLVQQSMNMAMLSQPTAMQTTGGSAGDQTMPSQNTTDEKRTDPQQSEHSDATANPESDTTQSPHMQTDGSDAGAATHGLINLNTAIAEELQSIKGIGPVTAQRIIDHRTAIGGYTSVDQLLDVKGIGSKTLETMRGQVTVG